VSAARANAQDALARATQAVQAVQQMQTAARNLAVEAGRSSLGANPNNPSLQLPSVPDGLGIGGLNPAAGATAGSSLWSGANLPTQTTSKGQTVVTVDQTSAQAVLTWQSFNVGSSTTLDFDQSEGGKDAGNWIVFNMIEDPSGVPSQILGSIHAQGQVYVMNQNGIIFGGASEVNVHALVASSLPINNYLIGVGLVNNPDDQFLFSSLAIPKLATDPTAPAFSPPAAPNGKSGNVTVEAGAVLESPANADNVGGKIALIGPDVTNAGTISTPDGQTILAAGQQVGFLPHAESDASLRGLDVYVGQGGGTATNEGDIIAPEADVTMVGAGVDQLGAIESTTSVSLNGRIDLKADSGSVVVQIPGQANQIVPTEAGSVTFGDGSITEILPELDSNATITGNALALTSQVNVQGKTIHMAGDGELLAPNATMSMQAGEWLPNPTNGSYGFDFTNGQIYLDSGALVDVAGSEDVSASVTQNIIAVQLLGPELADSPLQRNGLLRGQTIYVDIRDQGVYDGVPWIGTPLADVSGYAALVPYTVGELTTAGGQVTMQAGGSIVMQKGSEVNVSAGWIDYSGGTVTTTELISGGHIYNIADATPDLVYSGFLPQFIVSSAKWGTSATYDDPLITGSHYEDGYIYGGAGGSVTITAPATALDGTLLGLTENGERQVGPNSVQATPSALSIAFEGQSSNAATNYYTYAPTPPAVYFSAQNDLPAAAAFSVDAAGNPAALSAARADKVVLSPALLTSDGFGNLTVKDGDGSVSIPTGVTLDAGDAGSVTIAAANLDIGGSIVAPEGDINLTVYDYSPYTYQLLNSTGALITTPPADASRGKFVLEDGASLDVAGLVIDDRYYAPDPDTQPLDTAGGKVSIASYSVDLLGGSSINVSGGVEGTSEGKPVYGAAGSISILAGNDAEIPSLIGGNLELNATLLGYSGVTAGALTVQAPRVQIGGESDAAGVLLLAPDFFSRGGFGSFTIEALGANGENGESLTAFEIAPGTVIDPVASSLVAVPYAPAGGGLQVTTALLPAGSRTPVSLAFEAPGVEAINGNPLLYGTLVMGAGSKITTDPLANVTLSGQRVSVLGSIYAPGGTVTISGVDTFDAYGIEPALGTGPLPTVYISGNSTISAAGTTVYTPNNEGYVTGYVLAGGAISVSGNVLAEAGAVLDVSGASNTLDELPGYANPPALGAGVYSPATENPLNGGFLAPVLIESNGGSISLKGTEELYSDATLIGRAGGSEATGGSLTISSGVYNTTGNPLPPSQISLIVSENGLTIGAGSGPGKVVPGVVGEAVDALGQGHIAVQSFFGGGFDAVNLKGSVDFSGAVSITAGDSISVATSGFLYGNGAINLSAPYVTLGTAFQPPTPIDERQANPPFLYNGEPYYLAPTYGTGSLTITAQLINVGNLSLQGVGSVRLIADGGDIQGDGTLDVAGSIYLRAGQIYPPTETTFNIIAHDYSINGTTNQGSVTIASSGELQLPLSAGGTIDIYATNITQDGVLRAPFGTINLGWDGQGAAPADPLTNMGVDATQSIVLGDGSVTSVSAVDPLTGQGITIPYGVMLNDVSWIDPSGVDITTIGAPQKAISISGEDVTEAIGATIDIRGGGDLFAYQFVAGVDGENDILDTTSSYAILPGYSAAYAPYAPFNPDRPNGSTELANLGSDPGYVNSKLAPGDEIYLNASNGLPAGTYTLLPARYATLPGAFLVSPLAETPSAGGLQPDGASVVAGYLVGNGQHVGSNFEVEPPTVVENEAEYDAFYGTSFLAKNSAARTPADSGELNIEATGGLALLGSVVSAPLASTARGGVIDINSPDNIFIAGAGQTATAPAGDLVLESSQLSAIGAQTLIIGGYAATGANGTTVTVETNDLTVDNAGATLSAGDIILVANNDLTIEQGSSVEAEGSDDGGAGTIAITGDGALLRVSNDVNAAITRSGVNPSAAASLSVGKGVELAGASAILDSTQDSQIDSTAELDVRAVTIDSGMISILLPSAAGASPGGLVLGGNALQQIEGHESAVKLLSYSSIDIYGTGQIGATTGLGSLTLSAAEIRGYDQSGGTATLAGRNITIEGNASGSAPSSAGAGDGTLAFDGGIVHLGAGTLGINQFINVQLTGVNGITAAGAGSLAVQGSLGLAAPLITGAAGTQEKITAGGAVTIGGVGGTTGVTGGLAASLNITGASIDDNGNLDLPSGTITLHATNGDVVIGDSAKGELSVAGTVKSIFDLNQYTPGGTINLTADAGSVTLGPDGTINVSAPAEGGNAGTLNIAALHGAFADGGAIIADGGAGGLGGNLSLEVNSLPSFAALGAGLNGAGFTHILQIRVATGNVAIDGDVTARQFDLSDDQGSITVTGDINASGGTGGEITLAAAGSVILDDGAALNASGQNFNDAGKGGAVTLSAGADINGNTNSNAIVDVETGATINLSVAANTAGSQNAGDFTGTLLIRAPQNAQGTDVQVAPIDGIVNGASAIVVDGYRVYEPAGGQITAQLEQQIYNDGVNFLGADGVTTSGYTAMLNRVTGNSGLTIYLETGAEIINPNGDLTLGTPTSNSSSDWDLSTFRFGSDGTAGQLTMRASGNLVFDNTLSDGFAGSGDTALLLPNNAALPANIQSWSYTLTAGADLSAADPGQVIAGNGSVEIGRNDPTPYSTNNQDTATTASVINGYYQALRTGAGTISVSAGDNVELLNQFATIYTAGTQVLDPTMGGTFDVPELNLYSDSPTAAAYLGAAVESPIYPAQYSEAGGNVEISAVNNIEHLTENSSGQLVEDSSLELPNNWLYRRGYVDPATGQSGISKYGDNASTSWWVDFSNFFEGVGALGGGNVTLDAGNDVANVDAVAPTNARMPMGTPSATALVELGGGDVTVTAGDDINAGAYYVERGAGTLTAGNEILTNSTRSATLGNIISPATVDSPDAWLPTTLFLGDGSFTVTAGENLLLGPVANVFLMPQGISNTYWYKTYFSTYSTTSSVDVTSLAGSVTLRESVTPDGTSGAIPILENWLSSVDLYTGEGDTVSWYQPWLRLDETDVSDFATADSLLPGTLKVSALGGNIDVVGNLTLSPAPEGTLDLDADGSINAVQPNGLGVEDGVAAVAWNSSTIDVSDASPLAIPGVDDPFAYQSVVGTSRRSTAYFTEDGLLSFIDVLFEESGQTDETLQIKQELHAAGLLHAGDPIPLHIYAGTGSISGLTLYSPKETRVIAGGNITDVALYMQNDASNNISVVSAGGSIIAYDPDSSLRTDGQAPGNFLETPNPNYGDIQIGGPGTLEVLAGNDLNLGVGPNYTVSTGGPTGVVGYGITSVGNQRNPYLPQTGADVIAAAGLGPVTDLSGSQLGFPAFINQFVIGPDASSYLAELPTIETDIPSFSGAGGFDKLSVEERDIIALDVFYLVLRDAGRDHNIVGSPGFGNYDAADEAIADLFPNAGTAGSDISLTSREIATENGGNVSILDPGGELTVGFNIEGIQPLDQGIFTEDGGNISIYTDGSIIVGTSRIFTLRGGNEILWSRTGNIAAGESSKTVQEAPPTQVIVDPQSANVQTDLGGLATGGGIGVLASVQGVAPGDVDLIAPAGTVDAGDAGIRVTGNLNIAAVRVLNVGNIQVGGASAGVPVTIVLPPNVSALTAAANSAGAGAATADQASTAAQSTDADDDNSLPLVTVQVVSYGDDGTQ
jgi:filamentous hemagglutinin family protein